MFVRRSRKSGFTLIELMVVLIIVAVLAAVGIPMLSGNVNAAKASEGDAGLGTIRTAMRAAYVANNNAFANTGGSQVPSAANINIAATDLIGRYFVTLDYRVESPSPTLQAGGAVGAQSMCASVDAGRDGGGLATNPPTLARSQDESGGIHNSANCSGAVIPGI